jgi:hydroxymethylbilane synthase
VACKAFIDDELLFLSASVYSADGTRQSDQLRTPHPRQPLGRRSGGCGTRRRRSASSQELLGNGAADLAPREESQ